MDQNNHKQQQLLIGIIRMYPKFSDDTLNCSGRSQPPCFGKGVHSNEEPSELQLAGGGRLIPESLNLLNMCKPSPSKLGTSLPKRYCFRFLEMNWVKSFTNILADGEACSLISINHERLISPISKPNPNYDLTWLILASFVSQKLT